MAAAAPGPPTPTPCSRLCLEVCPPCTGLIFSPGLCPSLPAWSRRVESRSPGSASPRRLPPEGKRSLRAPRHPRQPRAPPRVLAPGGSLPPPHQPPPVGGPGHTQVVGVGWTVKHPPCPLCTPSLVPGVRLWPESKGRLMRAFRKWRWALPWLLRGFYLPGVGGPLPTGRAGAGSPAPSLLWGQPSPHGVSGCRGQRHPS